MNDREQTLEKAFLSTALEMSELLRLQQATKANRRYDRLHKIKAQMRQLPDRGEAALKRIAATTSDLEVKVLAAASLLAVDEPFACALLEAIRDKDAGLTSFTAKMTLQEWRAGSIREYWG
jgi:hypothetical protein